MPTMWPSVGPENIGTPDLAYAAQYLACTSPCERFASPLTAFVIVDEAGQALEISSHQEK